VIGKGLGIIWALLWIAIGVILSIVIPLAIFAYLLGVTD
jgi:hypothetical protein